MTRMPAAPRRKRADARLATTRILDAAIRTMALDSHASLERVAELASVHRATVYRHFTSREELINAIIEQALSEGRDLVRRVTELAADEDAVHCLAVAAVEFGQRYGFLVGTTELAASGPDPIGLATLMQTWQAHGLLRDDVTPGWLAAAFIALAQLRVPVQSAPSPDSDSRTAVGKLLAEMFLSGAAVRVE